MRRSRSSSNIPLPTSRRNASNENLENPQQTLKVPGLRRSNSSNNLFSAQKPRYSRNELAVNSELRASSSRTSYRRITATPLKSVGDGNVCRRINATPLSHSKAAPSPCVLLKTNTINDKKYMLDQFRKICEFREEKGDDFDPKSLKPLSLASFVHTISLLFKEIDSRINIDMGNYKEVVFKYLKLYKYPGPVSMSLLKSVNTNISWPPVMAIFGWMVDVIDALNMPNQDLLEQYLLCQAKSAIQTGSETKGLHMEFIEQILGFDRAESDMLEEECKILRQEAEKRKIVLSEKETRRNMLSEQLEQMKSEIKEFKQDNLEEKIRNETNDLQTELQSRVMKIEEMKQCISEKRQIISEQKYSWKDKKELLQKLEDKKYTLSLKKEELENVYKLRDDYDHQLTNNRRKIETEIHEINGRLLQLNLGNYVEDAKKIRLPDRGIHKPNFIEEIEEKKLLLENIIKQIDLEIHEIEKVLSDKQNVLKKSYDEIEKTKKETDLLRKRKEENTTEISRVLFEFDFMKKKHDGEMEKLRQQAPDIDRLKMKKDHLSNEVSVLKEELNKLKEECTETCNNIIAESKETTIEMRRIMVDLRKDAMVALQCKVEQSSVSDYLTENI